MIHVLLKSKMSAVLRILFALFFPTLLILAKTGSVLLKTVPYAINLAPQLFLRNLYRSESNYPTRHCVEICQNIFKILQHY